MKKRQAIQNKIMIRNRNSYYAVKHGASPKAQSYFEQYCKPKGGK